MPHYIYARLVFLLGAGLFFVGVCIGSIPHIAVGAFYMFLGWASDTGRIQDWYHAYKRFFRLL